MQTATRERRLPGRRPAGPHIQTSSAWAQLPRRRRRAGLLAATAGLFLLSAFLRPARGAEGLDHPPLPVAPELTVAEVVEAAWERYPAYLELAARQEQAAAWSRKGDSWLAGRPSLNLRYQTDRVGDGRGLREYESGLELPLWWLGEKAAAEALGSSYSSSAVAARAALRWQVAGLVRNALWDIALAYAELASTRESLDVAQALADAVQRRFDAGDVPRSDVLLAQENIIERQAAMVQAGVMQVDSERGFRTLTGLDRRPAAFQEQRSSLNTVPEDHPALTFVNAELQAADAYKRWSRAEAKGSPTLVIGPRRERVASGADPELSLGISVRIPFGGASHVDAEASAALREYAAARAERARVERELDLAWHEAEHGLETLEQTLALARRRVELTGEQLRMGRRAYETGELELLDLLRLQDLAINAGRSAARTAVQYQKAIATYNQAVGVLP